MIRLGLNELGYSIQSIYNFGGFTKHFGVARRLALSGAEVESGEVDRTMDGEVGELVLNTLWFDTSNSRLKCFRKSAPRFGMATGAS